MEIEIKVKLDTEKQDDLNLVEDLLEQLQDIRDVLEIRKQNLNNKQQRKKVQ